MSFGCILVPIDFSDGSLTAYQTALDLFASAERSLILLHAFEGRVSDLSQDQLGRNLLEEKKRQLASLANHRRSDWKEVTPIIEPGQPNDLIISTARTMGVELVIMGAGTGDSSIVKGLFGSTTYEVARRLKCSVMITKNPPIHG